MLAGQERCWGDRVLCRALTHPALIKLVGSMSKNTVWRLPQNLWLYLIVLLCQYSFAGLLLSLFHAPKFIWIVNQAVILHLAWANTEAVFLAAVWLVCLVWGEVISRSWLNSHPHLHPQDWATALIALWSLGLVFVLTLALSARRMESVGFTKTQAFWILLVITWAGLVIGSLTNSLFLSGASHGF